MNVLINGGRIELLPEGDLDRSKLAEIPEGTNEVFVYTTLDGGTDGNQEALVISIILTGISIPSLDEEEPKEDEGSEAIMAEFMGDIRRAVIKHWPRLNEINGFAGAHMIIGALEQAQQKILQELDKMLVETLQEYYFDLEEGS